ncbi:MAG TPA: hypothetical protein VIQ60_07340, partial [Gemmatimonadaceae bacterium]
AESREQTAESSELPRVQELQGSGFSDYEGTGNREQETGNCLGVEGSLPTSRYLFPVSCFLFPAVRSS